MSRGYMTIDEAVVICNEGNGQAWRWQLHFASALMPLHKKNQPQRSCCRAEIQKKCEIDWMLNSSNLWSPQNHVVCIGWTRILQEDWWKKMKSWNWLCHNLFQKTMLQCFKIHWTHSLTTNILPLLLNLQCDHCENCHILKITSVCQNCYCVKRGLKPFTVSCNFKLCC